MSASNAFAELGLTPDATEIEVKAAWRRLVSHWHPDRNGNSSAVAKMQRINQAYKAIRRSAFRTAPDHPSTDDPRRGQSGKTEGSHDSRGGDQFDDVRGTHTTGFDGDGASTRDTAGSDGLRRTISRKVKLTLEEAAAGCTKVLQGKVTDTCSTCAGAGYQVLGGTCADCEGSGALRQRSWFGWLGTLAKCEACQGSRIARQPCQACEGAGKAATRRYKFNVRIPHGARDGDLLHVDGSRPRSGQPPVDLDIRVQVLEHAFFELDEDGTIRSEIPVDGFAWIANRSIKVPTLTGLQSLQLSRDRLSYRISGQGFPAQRRGLRGDQLIKAVPIFPEQLSADQEILLDQLMASYSDPDGRPSDDRLSAWNRAVRAWERSLLSRSR